MKLKFNVTSKDLTTFLIFSGFLLFFCSLGTANVMNILRDDGGFTINIFRGFFPDDIIFTLIVFIIIEVVIFATVSSSIFEKSDSEGFGISIGDKESKGYSRWLKEKEMKKAYKIVQVGVKDTDASAAGVVLINDGKNMWVDDGEFHTLVVGTTGSGKTSAVINPLIYSLIKHKESMIMTDPKGELYQMHAEHLKARGYDVVVLNFRDPEKGNAWNPLTLPYKLYHEGNVDKAVELVDDVGKNIIKDAKAEDPFWQDSAGDYFSGCALGLIQDAKEEECNIKSINIMTTKGEDKLGSSTYIKEYFKMKGEDSSAYVFASNTINSPTETKGGILSTFRQKVRVFASRENLSAMLSRSDFDMADIGKKPTAVFIVIHDEKTTYHALATIFIKQCYETLIDVAQANGGPLPVRTNFLLDEFANMPALKDVTTMVTAARSRHIRFTFIIQNFAQLNDVYGKDDAETIRSNCGNLIYLLTTELAALEEISKLCGEVKSKKDDKTESHPLITVSDLQKLEMNQVVIIRHRQHPFKTKLAQAFNIDWGFEKYPEAKFVERESKPVEIFDIENFVNLRMKSRKPEPGMGGTNPFAGGNPFGGMSSRPQQNPFASLAGMGGAGQKPAPQSISSFDELFGNNASSQNPRPNPRPTPAPKPNGFNIEELMKKIDAKIAELEAEEEAENAANGGQAPKTENKFNPLIGDSKEVKDLPSTPKMPEVDSIDIEEKKPMEKSNISSFDEIMKKAETESKPVESIKTTVSTPVESKPVTQSFDSTPEFRKPLSGIVDPTKQTTYTPYKPEQSIVQEQREVEQTKPVETVKPVETKKEVPKTNEYADISDDQFFDDFFDEE